MSNKQAKRLRRAVRKESDRIKIQGLAQFFDFVNVHGFFGRMRIGIKIVFKLWKI